MAMIQCGRRLLLARNALVSPLRKQHGFIVLVPEIGEDLPDKNPLVDNSGLPEFNNITIEYCTAAIAKQTLECEAGVKEIEKKLEKEECSDVFTDIFKPLEELSSSLELTWGLSKTLYMGNSSKMPMKNYLAIHDRARRARSAKYNSVPIYNAVKTELLKSSDRPAEDKRMLEKFVLEGKLNGMELNEDKKAILMQNLKKIAQEKELFRGKTQISTKQFSQPITDPKVVRDFPQETLRLMATDPSKPLNGPWRLTLQPQVYLSAMEHCPAREIRWNLWQGMVGRGSGYRPSELATSLNLEEIRYNRRSIAKLLGYETFVDMSMETKMAGSKAAVQDMIGSMLEHALPAQESEIKALYDFALERGFKDERIQLWDVPYWRRKQRSNLFSSTEDDVKDYFPLTKVLEGLFALAERLFGITIKQRSNASTWHKDVRYFDIFESHSSAPVAGFYLDPYARSEEKIRSQNNGWMIGIQNKSRITDTKPLAALVFNFEPPTAEAASHLSFADVRSLFQRFGHAMQHLLSRTTYSEVSGLSNVEWDAVQVGGHVLTHWLSNREVIESISGHRDSGDTLPAQLFFNLTEVQKHLAGYDLCKELYLSTLDLELHSTKDFWLDLIKKLWPQYRLFPLEKIDSHPCSFTQIFSDEWGAAYYSQLWARMIAADIYSAFHEVQGDESKIADVGKRFRDTFLALGGSSHSSQTFRNFRGRDPSPKALLKSLGLKKNSDVV